MAPRKAAESDEAVAPRRSSRVATVKSSAETQVEDDSSSKKRKAAADGDKPAKTKKKAKAEDEAEEDGEPAEKLASIDIGDSLPTLTLKNEKDEDVEVSSLTADKGLVLFLVPKADTPGCTTQACGFRDIYPDFASLDYNVYCLSADTPAAQTKWQTKKEVPYPMLSDRKRVLITALGAGDGGKTKRSHFIFEKGGKLVDKKVPVKAGDRQVFLCVLLGWRAHRFPSRGPKLALDFIKSL
ncbi:AhpC-TSA-domain-containing protein [Mycena alexandri]|uniref:thioredoxin-dependent peroxiredoxin n=1 Tax=Mycena alexandri TaxID=1745969 RepID=A0AAD6TGH0_9AGAR|nr:AhpC-TSA-domain-containing protein [Mycena alexandri]